MTGACPRCGAPWSGEVACRQCGLLLGTPPPPPPPPPLPPDPEDRPDVWARRGGLATVILCIGLIVVGGLGLMLVNGKGNAAPVLAVWMVLAVAGMVEGVRAARGNLRAAIRAGIVDGIFGVFLLWLASITHLGGERMWGERDSGLKDMVSLLGFVALVAGAECIIGALVAKNKTR